MNVFLIFITQMKNKTLKLNPGCAENYEVFLFFENHVKQTSKRKDFFLLKTSQSMSVFIHLG